MIYFPPLRTARLDVQLRELTLREAVALAATPLDRHEAATAALLDCIVGEARGLHREPGRWTVQERMMVVAHYLAATSEGGGNFAIGDGQLLDYLRPSADHPGDTADAGQACGDAWVVRQLTGDEAAAMERLCRTEFDWLVADVAARLRPAAEDAGTTPDATDKPAAYADWLIERKAVLEVMPESDFWELREAYLAGLSKLHHLFDLAFDADGHVVLAKTAEDGGAGLAPARFSVAATITGQSRVLGARADRSSGLP